MSMNPNTMKKLLNSTPQLKITLNKDDKTFFSENGELDYVYRIMKRINSTHDLSQVVGDILNIMVDVVGCVGGVLFVVDEKKAALLPYAYSQTNLFITKVIPLLSKPFEDHPFYFLNRKNLIVRTAIEMKSFESDSFNDFMASVMSKMTANAIQRVVKMKKAFSIPAVAEGKVMGVFLVGFTQPEISPKKQRMIEFVADQCATALKNAERYNSLQEHYQTVKEVLAQQSDFMSTSCHEFRTPLAAALFQAEKLAETIHKIDSEPTAYKESLEMVRSLKRLQQITQRIFEAQAYDAKKITLKPSLLNLDDFSDYIECKFESKMKKKGLKWLLKRGFEEGASYLFDQDQLEKILSELIWNAMHFSPPGGQIILDVHDSKNHLQFNVSDSGEGIPSTERENVFKKFKGNHSMHSMGIGLGLYIVKKIVELHTGEVWVKEGSSGGTMVGVRLPKNEA